MCARPVLCCLNMLLIGFAATTIGVLFWLEHGLPRFPLYVPIAVSTFSVTSGFLGCVAQFRRGCRRAHWAIFSISFLLLVGVFLFLMLRKYVVVRLLLQSGRNTVKAASDVLLFCQITFFLMILSQTAVVGSSCCCRGKRLRDAGRPVIGHAAQTHARHTDSTHPWPRPMASCRIEISTTNDRVFRSASDDRVSDSGAPSGRFSAGSTSSGDVPWAKDCEGSRVAEIFARETAPMPFGPRAARVTRDLQVEYMRQLTNNSERQRHSTPESEELAGGYSSSETVPDAEFEISSISSTQPDADADSVYSALSDIQGGQSTPESPSTGTGSSDAKQAVKMRNRMLSVIQGGQSTPDSVSTGTASSESKLAVKIMRNRMPDPEFFRPFTKGRFRSILDSPRL